MDAAYARVMALPLPAATTAIITRAIEAAAGSVMPYRTLEKQKRFMRRKMRKPADMTIRQYAQHLVRINDEELPHLPPYVARQKLSDDEMMDIIIFGIPKSWTNEMSKQDFDAFAVGRTIRQVVEFCERLESVEDTATVTRSNTSNKKAKHSNTGKNTTPKPEGKWCEFHKTKSHDTSECEALKKAAKNGKDSGFKSKNKTWDRKSADAKKLSKKELALIVKKASELAYKKAKRELNSVTKRKKADDDEDEQSSVGSVNAIETKEISPNKTIEQLAADMKDVDAQLSKFNFGSTKDVEV